MTVAKRTTGSQRSNRQETRKTGGKKTNKISFVKDGASSKVFKFFLEKFEITVKIKIKKDVTHR
jgi:hypothetical protein